MLDGKWGIGKSYFIKNKLYPRLDKQESINCAIISLYGINNLSEVSKSIYLQLRLHLNKANTEKNRIKTLAVNTVVRSIIGYLKIDMSDENISDLYESICLDNTLIILEDIERSSIDIFDILGYVNDLTENNDAKILLVTNEDAVLYNNIKGDLQDMEKKIDKDSELTKKYLQEKEKTISDTIKFKGNYKDAIKAIISDMNFDDSDKMYFTEKESIKIIAELASNGGICNLRTFIFACQKTVDIFSKIKRANKNYDFDFRKNIFYGIIAFCKKLKNNETTNWDADANLISLKLGNYQYPLFRFCYNYILYQEFEYSDIDIAYAALQDLKQYNTNYNMPNDEDFDVINNYYLHTEKEVINSLMNLENKLKANPVLIPVKHYGVLANLLTIMHKLLNYDYTPILDVMCENVKGAESKIDCYLLFEFGVNFEKQDEEIIYKEITEKLINSMQTDTHEHFILSKNEYKNTTAFCETINSNKTSILKKGKFTSRIDIDEFVNMIKKALPSELQQMRKVFKSIYLSFEQNSFVQEEIHALDELKSRILLTQTQDNFDRIKQLQLQWFIKNIDEYIESLKEYI